MSDAREDPMAYMAFAVDGSESCGVYIDKAEAQTAAEALGGHIVPLHLAARLTDDEQAAVEWCLGWSKGLHVKNHAVLLSLLERMT
jgi:hypothetical protein